MFERVGSLAERVAANVSRRAFLGRLGQGALALAGAMGAMLVSPGLAQAKGCAGGPCRCCCYQCSDGTLYRLRPNPQGTCKDTLKETCMRWRQRGRCSHRFPLPLRSLCHVALSLAPGSEAGRIAISRTALRSHRGTGADRSLSTWSDRLAPATLTVLDNGDSATDPQSFRYALAKLRRSHPGRDIRGQLGFPNVTLVALLPYGVGGAISPRRRVCCAQAIAVSIAKHSWPL
jgi:hypothetical protein